MDVNKDPGPSTTRSASRMASRAGANGTIAPSARRLTRSSAVREWHATAWPSTTRPSRVRATSVTRSSVEGYTPRARAKAARRWRWPRKRPRRILERREHEVAECVVAREREAVLERLGQRIGPDPRPWRRCTCARRRGASRRPPRAGCRWSPRRRPWPRRRSSQAPWTERADGHGRARAAADHDGTHALAFCDGRGRRLERGEAAVADGSWVKGCDAMAPPQPRDPDAGAGSGGGGRKASIGAFGQREVAMRDAHRDSPSP